MDKKVIVITGASSGIGAALARLFGSQGHSLVLAARREERLKEIAREFGSRALPVVTDVTKRKDVERLRDMALKEFGHIDVWVNDAGRGVTKTVMELTDGELDEMLNVNFKSVFYGCKRSFRILLDGGRVI